MESFVGASLFETGLFLLIGVIVSLDVAGLTAVRTVTYTGTQMAVRVWAVQDAFWHAILLFVYGAITVAVFDIALPKIFDAFLIWIRQFEIPNAEIILEELANHALVLFSCITVFIIWRIYVGKIVENPFDVSVNDDGLQRKIIHMLLRFVSQIWKLSTDFVGRNMQSVATALDMLALAFLMKSLGLFEESFVKVSYISVCIFFSVFATTTISAYLVRKNFLSIISDKQGKKPKKEKLILVIFILRLLEPLLIFYFVCEMMSFVVWRHLSSSSLLFLGSGMMVVALCLQVGLLQIKAVCSILVDELVADFNNA